MAEPLTAMAEAAATRFPVSGATPANWSAVMLRMQLPDVWMACICTEASLRRISGVSSSSTQLNWMFVRVEKWP